MGFLRDVCHNDAILLRRHVEKCPGWDEYVAFQGKRGVFQHEMEVRTYTLAYVLAFNCRLFDFCVMAFRHEMKVHT
jgi:hypothetical protein